MKIDFLNDNSGFSALIVVLIIAAAGLIMAKSAAIITLDKLDGRFLLNKRSETEYIAEGCAEEALRRIRIDNEYSATSSAIAIGPGSCIVSVAKDLDNRIITAKSNLDSYYKALEARAVINEDAVVLTDWAFVEN